MHAKEPNYRLRSLTECHSNSKLAFFALCTKIYLKNANILLFCPLVIFLNCHRLLQCFSRGSIFLREEDILKVSFN